MALRGFGRQVAAHVKISQLVLSTRCVRKSQQACSKLVNKMCSQQACSKLVNKL